MKRLAATFLVLVLLLMAACSSTDSDISSVKLDWESADLIKLEDLLKQTNEKHLQECTGNANFEGFEEYLVEGAEYQNLLTEDEITALKYGDNKFKQTVTREEAIEDVELYFRTLKYAYGAYFYFGGDERFEQAKNEVLEKLKDVTEIESEDLRKALISSVSFVRDAHFGFGEYSSVDQYGVRYEYYYCNLYFSKDNEGFYAEKDSEKWYVESFENEGVVIEPTLTDDGDVKYSPVLFKPTAEIKRADIVTLVSGEKKMEVPFNWTLSQPYRDGSMVQDFIFEESNGLAYISIRRFHSKFDEKIYSEYEETANKIKDCKAIIYDIRSNTGGSDDYSKRWVENFTEAPVELNTCYGNRVTVLANDIGREISFGEEYYKYGMSKGTFASNDIPVFILVDDMTGSSGESAMNYAKTIENAIVIGSNSSGYQLCGNVRAYYLPNSGIEFNMPVRLQFINNMENVDGKGYEPDIWCNPKTALDVVYKLIEKQNITELELVSVYEDVNEGWPVTEEHVEPVQKYEPKPVSLETLEKLNTLPPVIEIQYAQFIVKENEGFGSNNFDDTIIIMNNGIPVSDYTITFENPDIAKVSYNADGSVHIKLPTPGNWPFVVTYRGKEYKFILAV